LPETFDVAAIDRFFTARVQEPGAVGLSVAIYKDGRMVLAKGYGKMSLQADRPVTPETRFAIGSVTKQFTCAAVLLLAEEGRLSIHDPVAKYYPALSRATDITILDLMQHVSGYPDYYPLDFVDRRMRTPIDPDELLRRYAGGRLDFQPHERWSYSNTGYVLLGRIVEKITGETFQTYLERRILHPLGLRRTVYEPTDPGDSTATGHAAFALGGPEIVGPEGSGWIGAAGGLYSTPTDLVTWDVALMEGKLLKPESYRILTTPGTLSDGRVTDYGCGLAVRTEGGRQVFVHNGAVSGFNAWNAFVPSTRSAVAMTCNLEGGMGAIPGRLLSLLLKDPSRVPAIAGPAAAETVREIFAALQSGTLDRTRFSLEFNEYLTDARVEGAAARLRPYGAPRETEVLESRERGGMEVTVTRLGFGQSNLRILMYRNPDGRIQQYFVHRQ
jgi:CubicO group peptidase (beta-lactamase class C family)